MRMKTFGVAAVSVALLLTACGGDDDSSDDAASTPSSEADDSMDDDAMDDDSMDDGAETIEVTGVDYSFQGIPAEIAVGSTIAFTNASEAEVHEIVALNYGDDDRPVADLLAEFGAAIESGEGVEELLAKVRLVHIQGPGGQPDVPAVGDGTLPDPGRYIFVCAIQQGVDPEAYFAEAARMQEAGEDGPVMLEDGGPPHVQLGMLAEAQVS